MLFILALYLTAVWIVFSKMKLISWGWVSGAVTVFIGVFILAVFLAFFNFLTPSGRITVVSRVVEVMPNVSGEVTAIAVKPNVPVKTGTVLFQIDQSPFRSKVTQLEAALVGAQQQALSLKSNYEQTSANVAGLVSQVAFHQKRLNDIQTLTRTGATTPFREQDTRDQLKVTTFQLQAARAAQQSAKFALDSEVGGVNTTVAQTRAQLDNAKWELEQTTIRAPSDGYATVVALAVGDRALQARAAMSFIVSSDLTIIGMFAQNGFRTIRPGVPVRIVFDNNPGRTYDASIKQIPEGIGQGQIAVSGTLARTTAIGGATTYPAEISIPSDVDPSMLKLGMSGNATAFSEKAGVIGLLAKILIWISSYTAYL
jgi:multidrug resistance efflux pump